MRRHGTVWWAGFSGAAGWAMPRHALGLACPCLMLSTRRRLCRSTRRRRCAGKRGEARQGCWHRRPLATLAPAGLSALCGFAALRGEERDAARRLEGRFAPVPAAGLPGCRGTLRGFYCPGDAPCVPRGRCISRTWFLRAGPRRADRRGGGGGAPGPAGRTTSPVVPCG